MAKIGALYCLRALQPTERNTNANASLGIVPKTFINGLLPVLGVNWSPMLLTRGHLLTNEIGKIRIGIGHKIGRAPLLKHKKTWKKHVNTHKKTVFVRTSLFLSPNQWITRTLLNPPQPQQQAYNNL